MKDTTKDVDTQDIDDLNTETDLEQDDINIEENDTDIETSDDIDKKTIDSLNDDQFLEFLSSGKLPDGREFNSKIEGKEGDNDESTSRIIRSGKTLSDNSGKSLSDTSVDTRDKPIRAEQDKGANRGKSGDRSSDQTKETEKGVSKKLDEIDYKNTYETIFKPFKANGKQIEPKTVDDVIALMQMGSNYTKKMQDLTPMRKVYESLNKAEIGDSELNFLIDVYKGDKEAIKKLLKKHEVDPIELDLESTDYVPKNNLVSDEDVEYSNVLEDIQSSLPKIQEVISKTWDAKSKQMLLKDPNLIKALHEEIELGRFDEVQARLEIEKTFGRFKGKSDVEAYIELVTKMVQEKSNSNTNKNTNTNVKPANTPNKNIPDKSKAAPNKSISATSHGAQLTPRDLLSMSEEEFKKLSLRNLV